MLREKVGLYIRITTPKGKRFVKPHPTRDGYIFNAEGKAERRPDGVYYFFCEMLLSFLPIPALKGFAPIRRFPD